ncbi:hypothetical protein ACOCEA_05730 [Maribacter sp. CXY002]|uniref:hypothetical protein n=1 Tax=Maribacter luteocoastalis TaxID=3407671 RepID=UPI003B67412C
MRSIFFTLFLVVFLPLTAQKKVAKSILKESIHLIQIDANSCFEVVLQTSTTNEILIEAQMDGEYSNELFLNLLENGNTLQVNAGFGPNYKNPNDKLSAHKVVSIALKVTIPQFKNVKVHGTSANIIAYGEYDNLGISLSDGICRLKGLSGKVEVKTQNGNIFVEANKAIIISSSKYGTVSNNPIDDGASLYQLSTVTGDIILNKTK